MSKGVGGGGGLKNTTTIGKTSCMKLMNFSICKNLAIKSLNKNSLKTYFW